MIYELGERKLRTEGDHFIADTAVVIGSVVLGHNVSVWFNAVLRGDNEPITVGENSNIQDLAVLHTDVGGTPVVVGRNVTVGHKAMLHGCRVEIGRNCLIGACALIPERKKIPDNSLVMGIPGKVVGEIDAEREATLLNSAQIYVDNFKRYQERLARA
jgi:carbonic anhydrase/acetyltransferase-like protein (isoleucine patch superfamily)